MVEMKVLKRMSFLFFFCSLFFSSEQGWAYPDFIAYGYNSCMACHYNGQGGGALTEYGKGLMASEFSSRMFYPKNVTDDELAENSAFPGTASLPWWYRPGVKYRGLWFQNNPGSSTQTSKYVTMQADLNNAFFFDQNQKYVFITSIGVNSNSLGSSSDKIDTWISRESYLRWQAKETTQETIIVYAGLMDKIYGIRHVDHTAYGRKYVGLAQNDQTHGVAVTLIRSPWDLSLHGFLGNLYQDSSVRQKGFSMMAEKDIRTKWRAGFSAMSSSSDLVSWNRGALHSKFGFGEGHSLLSEVGVIQNKPKTGDTKTGLYGFLSSMSLITRGFHFLSQFEYFNETMNTKSADKTRLSVGLLAFPAPRFEFRTMLLNGRSISDSGVTDDQWSIQAQLHVSI